MKIVDFVLHPAVVAAVVSAFMSLFLVPYSIRRAEMVRREMEAKREVMGWLGTLRFRLRKERIARRRLSHGAQVARREFMTYDDAWFIVWRIVSALGDLAMNPRIARDLKALLGRLFGRWRIEYLETCMERPSIGDPNLAFVALVAGQAEPANTPFDRMLQGSGSAEPTERRPEDVDEALQVVEEAFQIAKGRSIRERLTGKLGRMRRKRRTLAE